jgi:regulatory associated protein of mTOR
MALLLESPFTKLPSSTLHAAPYCPEDLKTSPQPSNHRPPKINVYGASPYPSSPNPLSSRPSLSRADTGGTITSLTAGVSNTLRRTSSFANALKSLANGIAFPSADGDSAPKTPNTATPLRREIIDISRPPSPNLNVAQYASPYSQPLSPPGTPNSHRRQPSQESYLTPVPFTASDVMEALTEEDIERLRARRRQGGNGRGRHGGMPSPSNSTFSTDSTSSVTLGLGTGASIRDTLPLKSSYFDWCCEYFKEPQMRVCTSWFRQLVQN